MQIILMRHGRPAIEARQRLSANGFGIWVGHYNAAAIDPASPPPAEAIEQARQAAYVLCSTLPRSLTSAAALGVETPHRRPGWHSLDGTPRRHWQYAVFSRTTTESP